MVFFTGLNLLLQYIFRLVILLLARWCDVGQIEYIEDPDGDPGFVRVGLIPEVKMSKEKAGIVCRKGDLTYAVFTPFELRRAYDRLRT